MRHRERGTSLLEMLIYLALVGSLAVVGVPPLLRISAQRRLELAAAEVRSAMYLARSIAIRHGVNAAVKFRLEDGQLCYALYRDGDGDGVLNADIRSGTDPMHGPTHRLWHAGTDIRFGFPPGRAPRDPGDPRRRLDRLDDPIRFNASDLASFDPWGGATPGTAYLTDGHHLMAVRIPGRSARVKWLRYDPILERWN
jgi:type II secretory pathway pseudopilin PulG